MTSSHKARGFLRRLVLSGALALPLLAGLSWASAPPASAEVHPWYNDVIPGMPTQVNAFGTAVVGNIVYVVGGFDGANPGGTNLLQALDPTTDTWSEKATMPIARSYFSAATGPDGRIYAVGGYGDPTEVDAYDPTSNTWTTVAPLPYGVADAQVVTDGGLLYVMGGIIGTTDYLSTVEAYNPSTDTWTAEASMPQIRLQFGATRGPDGRIYIAGGIGASTSHESVTNSLDIYNPTTNRWSRGANMPAYVRFAAMTVTSTGLIVALGGDTGGFGGGVASKVANEYDPVSNTWAKLPNLLDANGGGGAADVTNVEGEEEVVSATGADSPAPTDLMSVPGDFMADGYVLANKPTAASYTPTSAFQWNSTNALNTIKRSGVGDYTVKLPFLAKFALNGGTVDVTPVGSSPALCNAGGWSVVGAAVEVQVLCWDDTGAPLDSEFTASFTAPYRSTGTYLAYAWADNPTAASYTPDTGYQYDVAGGTITISNVGTGQYVVTLPNLGSIAGLDGTVQVTPYGTTPASCDVANWGPLGSAETIKLDCTTPSGAPVDTYYDVSFAFGGNILGDNWLGSAYLLADSPTTTRYTPANQYNSLGLSNTVKRTATGTYTASLPNEAIGGDPQVTSYASDNRCQVASFTSPVAGGTAKVSVLCFDPSGALVDSAYMLQWAHGH